MSNLNNTLNTINTLTAENIEATRGTKAGHPNTHRGLQLGRGWHGTAILDHRQFHLTQRGLQTLTRALERATKPGSFTLSEQQLKAITNRPAPALNGQLITLTEGQLSEVLVGRRLSELTDPAVTYTPVPRAERFTAMQRTRIRELTGKRLALTVRGPEWHENPGGHLITL